MTLYDTLGISPDADAAAISKAFRRAARRSHPDKGGSKSAFQKVEQAGRVLRDPQKRLAYDQTGHAEESSSNEPLTDEQHAANMIKQLFIVVLEGKPPKQPGCLATGQDPIVALRQEIKQGLTEGPAIITAHRRKIAKLEKAFKKQLKRMHEQYKEYGEPEELTQPYLEQALSAHIAVQKAALAQMELLLRIGPIMLEMLKSYRWEGDEPYQYIMPPWMIKPYIPGAT